MSKKVLIKQDDELLASICSDLKFFDKAFKTVLETYSTLALGDFTDETFKDVVTANGEAVVNKYKETLNSQLDTTGVTNTVLRGIILQGSDEHIHKFCQAVKDFINTVPLHNTQSIRYVPRAQSLLLSDLSFVNGSLVITEQAKETILERDCRTYVEGADEISFYMMLKKLEATLQDYTSKIKELEIPYLIGENPVNTLDSFFDYDWDRAQFSVRPESVKWALTEKAQYEAATQKAMDRMSANSNTQRSQQNIF